MALVQLNLKVPPAVASDWRRRAAEAGHRSVRDWLLATLSPTAESAPDLADRVAALEAELTALRDAVAALQERPVPPVRSVSSPRPLQRPAAPAGAVPAGGIETPELAVLLGIRRHTLNEQIRRAGGPQPGLELHGWRCIGTRPADRGGPPRAVWIPAATADGTEITAEPVPAPPGLSLEVIPVTTPSGTG